MMRRLSGFFTLMPILLPLGLGLAGCFRGEMSWEQGEMSYALATLPSGSRIVMNGPSDVVAGVCVELEVEFLNSEGRAFSLKDDTRIHLFPLNSSDDVQISKYLDPGCTLPEAYNGETIHDTFAAGQSKFRYYFNFESAGFIIFGARVDGIVGIASHLTAATMTLVDPMSAIQTIAGPLSARGYVNSASSGGSDARFSSPQGIVGDSTYASFTNTTTITTYVADQDNHVIRKVIHTQVGIATPSVTASIAGGEIAGNTFDSPRIIVQDPSGSSDINQWTLLIADECVIRSLNVGSGVVTLLVGSEDNCHDMDGTGSSAQLSRIQSMVAFNAGGNHLYVTTTNGSIRRVALDGLQRGVITTLNFSTPIVRPGPLASDGAWIYVVDRNSSGSIVYFNPNEHVTSGPFTVSTKFSDVGGSYFESLSYGSGFLFGFNESEFVRISLPGGGPFGSAAYFSRSSGTKLGAVDGIIGSGNPGAIGPRIGGLFWSSSANRIVFTDSMNHSIRAIALGPPSTVSTLAGPTGQVQYLSSGTGSSARFAKIDGLATGGPGGHIYALNERKVQQVTPSSGAVVEVLPAPPAGITRNAIAVDESGSLYAAEGSATSASVTAPVGVGARSSIIYLAPVTYPTPTPSIAGIAVEHSPAPTFIYISNQSQHQVLKYVGPGAFVLSRIYGDPAGTTSGYAEGAYASARFSNPGALAISPDNQRLYVFDSSNGVIRAIDLTTDIVTTFAGGGTSDTGTKLAVRIGTISSLTVDSKYLYLSAESGKGIRRISLLEDRVEFITQGNRAYLDVDGPIESARVSDVMHLISDGAGGLFFSNFFNLRWIHP